MHAQNIQTVVTFKAVLFYNYFYTINSYFELTFIFRFPFNFILRIAHFV